MSGELKNIETIEHVTVSTTVLANLFNVTTRRIRQLENEGVIEKVARGKYSLKESINKYITYIKATNDLKEDKASEENVNYEEEHALLEKTKRQKAEIELAAMQGKVHFSSDVERVMTDMLSNFKSKILALPSRAAPNLISLESIAEIQEFLQLEVLDVLHELSNYNPDKFYNEDYVGINEEDS